MIIRTFVTRSRLARASLSIACAWLLATSISAQESRPAGGQAAAGGQAPNPEAFVDRMMQNDANGDGKLSKDEVPGNFADRLFESGDADKDGFLTREELAVVAANFPRAGGRAGAGEPGAQASPAGGRQVSFSGSMNQAQRNFRTLSRSTFDAETRESDLQAIGNIQAALIGAKSRSASLEMAEQAKARYGEDLSSFRRDVHKALLKAIAVAIELELAILDGESAKAKELLQKLDDAEHEGHDAFQPQE